MPEASKVSLVAGVDEVGRGPLAGPVVAAAVVLDAAASVPGIADSKQLSHGRRIMLAGQIKAVADAWCIGVASVEEIERLNILQAALLAMRRAVLGLPRAPHRVLVDGNRAPNLPFVVETVVGGDRTVAVISAASILAKVYRDHLMERLDAIYPGYEFAANKGYPTVKHRYALRSLGYCRIHRRTFKGVKECLPNCI
ncbi:MAG: ribonuclease HII [Gammaproteobacteria bacterium]|nr:ribonuclease HII [Gammaproteobacteria bacterium]MDH3468001.1 ribonuclease HII [Gammaproteobacteria bacterium]